MKLAPGKYVQRDGWIATVALVDETKSMCQQAIGWDADGYTCSWSVYGLRWEDREVNSDLIAPYVEPKKVKIELWVNVFEDGTIWPCLLKEDSNFRVSPWKPPIHCEHIVREIELPVKEKP